MNQKYANISAVLEPVKSRFASVREMAEITGQQLANVERIEYQLPRFGMNGFGKFKITYRTPQLREVR